MNLPRRLFGLALGRRLPTVSGTLKVPGLEGPLTIRRDRWGVPHVRAEGDADAWFGLGFCQGQDRSFQLEILLRVVRGTVAELVGKKGLAIDRLSRRIGFMRGAKSYLDELDPEERQTIEAYTRGVTAGATQGLPRRAHELVLLRSSPTPWTGADVIGIWRLQCFMFSFNADVELARLKILTEDGPDALAALDPTYPDWLPVSSPAGALAGPAVDRLVEDVTAFSEVTGAGGASNQWALTGARTATGRPLLVNDIHVTSLLPSPWYLAHLTTPEWSIAGISIVGGPAFPTGHNGFSAWGVTAALVDNTDLFVEQIGPDGASVRQADGFARCDTHHERIAVKWGKSVTEKVLITPHGPIIGPALTGEVGAISLQVMWLQPTRLRGLMRMHRVHSFEELRQAFADWPAPAFNMMYADPSGSLGWQLVGNVPRRRKGWGNLPLPGWAPGVGWEEEPVPYEAMPHTADPATGFLAATNNPPLAGGSEPFLGLDFADGYRLGRIWEMLGERTNWDVAAAQAMQNDVQSLPWREMREMILAAPSSDPDAALALDLLRGWDGRVSAGSAGACVFELFLAGMAQRIVLAKAPRGARWALGLGFIEILPYTTFSARRVGHLVSLLRESPEGWFPRRWDEEVADVLRRVVRHLRGRFGDDPAGWGWGRARPLTLRHPVGGVKPLDRVFNLGPVPFGGDYNTICLAAVDLIEPATTPALVPSARAVIDVGGWDESRFVLPAGQSGNPLSPHYDDQFPLWRRGDGIPIPFSKAAVEAATVHTLRLVPLDVER